MKNIFLSMYSALAGACKDIIEQEGKFDNKKAQRAIVPEGIKTGEKMRKHLKEARQKAGMTQKQVAEYLKITLRSYQRIESGDLLGAIKHWDALEDLFMIPQRELRQETCLTEEEGS